MTMTDTDRVELRLVVEIKTTSSYNLVWMIEAIKAGLEDGERVLEYHFSEPTTLTD